MIISSLLAAALFAQAPELPATPDDWKALSGDRKQAVEEDYTTCAQEISVVLLIAGDIGLPPEQQQVVSSFHQVMRVSYAWLAREEGRASSAQEAITLANRETSKEEFSLIGELSEADTDEAKAEIIQSQLNTAFTCMARWEGFVLAAWQEVEPDLARWAE